MSEKQRSTGNKIIIFLTTLRVAASETPPSVISTLNLNYTHRNTIIFYPYSLLMMADFIRRLLSPPTPSPKTREPFRIKAKMFLVGAKQPGVPVFLMGHPQATKISGEGTDCEAVGCLLFCSPAVSDLLIPGDLSLSWQSGTLGGRSRALRGGRLCRWGQIVVRINGLTQRTNHNIHMTAEVKETHPG